ISALEYYKGTLETLINDQEIVPTETDRFENYLENARNDAAIAAEEIRAEPRNIGELIDTSAFKHKNIVHDALSYYIRGLVKSEKTIFDKFGEDKEVSKSIVHYYNEQKKLAGSLLGLD
ncbi:MAG TPA: hypothetical protein VGE97_10490, partial [Nitrososphaera sp.]